MKIKDYAVSVPTAGSKILGTSEAGTTENYSIMDMNISIPESNYKVFTALLTQNGADVASVIDSGLLTIGVTYNISSIGVNSDFTNVGAPNNNLGTSFIATGTAPGSWGGSELTFNQGAPVVRILANTIGNVWFTYSNVGVYKLYNSMLIDESKLYFNILSQEISSLGFAWNDEDGSGAFILSSLITDAGVIRSNDLLASTSIEIRVYN